MPASSRPIRGRSAALLGALLLTLLLSPLPAAHPAPPAVTGYRPLLHPFLAENGALWAAVRQFERGGKPFFLVLDPRRFELREMAAAGVRAAPPAGDAAWRQTPFFQALARRTAPPYPLQNAGLREAESPRPGYFLTADLCPSPKPLDRAFLAATAALPQKAPVPVTLMISGPWLRRHPEDLAWIKEQAAAGRLDILWGNHSFTHRYDKAAPLERNFLLAPNTDFTAEVLGLERLLLEEGLAPSPFFRFPGLVADRRLIEALRDLSLIPIGSNAWLAKGDRAKPGSVILVHGNGNEPEGIRRLLHLYAEQREAFRRGEAALLPLREAFSVP